MLSSMPDMTDRSPAPSARVSYIDAAIWHRFQSAADERDYFDCWLTLQCSMLSASRRAGLALVDASGEPSAFVATWPSGIRTSGLEALAGRAVAERAGLVEELGEAQSGRFHFLVAHPIVDDGATVAVVVVEVAMLNGGQEALQAILRQLQWGGAWVAAFLRRASSASDSAFRERLISFIDLLVAAIEPERFGIASRAFVTEIARALSCDRVGLGLIVRDRMRVLAISHTAQLGREMALVRGLARLMEESVDQGRPVVVPSDGDEGALVVRAHLAHLRQEGATAIATLPLYHAGRVVGAVCCERLGGEPYSSGELEVLRALAAMAGPILREKFENDRWLPVKAWISLRRQLVRLFGPGHLIRKLAATTGLVIALCLAFVDGDYRVVAATTIEGAVQRQIVAPIDGYLADCPVRAGDRVESGDLLCRLDDRDLRLEHLKWSSERAKYLRKRDEARANGNRGELNVVLAQIDQAEARLALVEERLSRLRITAPFDGIVIRGDMSRRLGGSVERGEVLFEMAPLRDYRVMLDVDEHDIAAIAVGQSGRLVLASYPGRPLDFSVVRLVPVARAVEGRNVFPVEARLVDGESGRPDLRPGMKGVGKISVDRRPLGWIWGHEIADRLRLWWWRWIR